jgi:hypothetical protein
MCAIYQELLLMHAPTMAGKKHHELQAFANRVWRMEFKDSPELKNKTLDIYETLYGRYEKMSARKASLEREVPNVHPMVPEVKGQIKCASLYQHL